MTHIEVAFKISPYSQFHEELLIASLEENGFDSFWQDNEILKGYIPSSRFSIDNIDNIEKLFKPNFTLSYTYSELEEKNWNEEWEKNFPSLVISNKCLIRAPFHEIAETYEYVIIIEPKMSFGTGHHSTTSLMIENILMLEIENKSILDMGCGTGILSILASKMNANKIFAIDNDKWAYENSLENIQKNNCSNIEVILGDANSITDIKVEIIFANINRNIILEDFEKYQNCLSDKGLLIISGFLCIDKDIIIQKASSLGFKSIKSSEKNGWVSEVLIKN